MTEEEYEQAYLAKWGRPCWEQYYREAKAAGMTDKQAHRAYMEDVYAWANGSGKLV